MLCGCTTMRNRVSRKERERERQMKKKSECSKIKKCPLHPPLAWHLTKRHIDSCLLDNQGLCLACFIVTTTTTKGTH